MNSGLTLGELIAELERLPEKAVIELDFGGAVPTTLDSYRGYYDQLALGYTGEYGATTPTVGSLLAELKSAVGKTFQGWKGGDYVMTEKTNIFIANPGCTSDTYIKEVVSKYEEWYSLITREEEQ